MIERLPVGKYTLREESAPYGYKVASDVTFEVKETAEIQKVSMKDEQAVGKIVIEKTDKVTGKPIEGVVFEVRDKDGKVLDTLTTDKNGHAESKELPICTYNEDGSFKEDIHYTVVETKAADGYILDETAHDVTLRYDDNAPDVVVATLKLANVPTEPKLPQTGDNANPLLYLGIGALALITGVGVSWFFRCLWSFFISRIVRYGWCLRNIRCLCQAFSCLRIHFLTSRGIFQIAGSIIQPDCSAFHHSPYTIRYTHKYFRSICLFCLHCILCHNGRFSIIGKYRHWRTKSHSKCQKACQCLCPDPF